MSLQKRETGGYAKDIFDHCEFNVISLNLAMHGSDNDDIVLGIDRFPSSWFLHLHLLFH